MPKYLDDNGLLYFWQKIKSKFLTNVAYDSTNKKLTKTINGSTSDIVSVSTIKTALNLSKSDVGLGNVDNTSDANKPISTATQTALDGKVDAVSGKGLSTNDFTTTLKNKLDGIASGAEVNQNAFSNVKVGSTTVAADAKTDTLELVAGSNITLTPDATNDKVTIAATDTTYSNATTSAAGLMSASDKTRLNSIGVGVSGISNTVTWNYVRADGITANVAPVDSSTGLIPVENLPEVVAGGASGVMTGADKTKLNGIATGAEVNQNAFSNVKVGSTTVAADGKTDTLELVAGSNVTLTPDDTNDTITIAATDTTYSNATTSAAGLMSASDKTKLNGIATGAQVNQNAFSNVKVGSTTVAADSKTDTLELVAGSNVTLTPDATDDKITIAATYSNATTSAAGLMSSTDKAKLDALADVQMAKQSTDNAKLFDIKVKNNSVITTHHLIQSSAIGANNGVASLDANGKVPSSQLPSYVDDVIEAYARSLQSVLSSTWLATESASGPVITPESGKIYVLMADSSDYAANTQFRWSGTAYVKLNDGGVSAITNSEIDTILAA